MSNETIEITRPDLEKLLLNAFHVGVQTVYEHARTAAKNGLGEKVATKMVDQLLSGEIPAHSVQ